MALIISLFFSLSAPFCLCKNDEKIPINPLCEDLSGADIIVKAPGIQFAIFRST